MENTYQEIHRHPKMDTQVWMYAHLRIYAAISPTKPIDSISINADLTSCVMYMGHDILFSVIPGVPFINTD